MQKLESSLKNMVLVLVGVALIVGAVLAYINHLTSGPIAEKAAQSLAAGIKSVMGTEELQVAEPEEVKQEFGVDNNRVLSCLPKQWDHIMIGRGAFHSASKVGREPCWSVWKSKCRYK